METLNMTDNTPSFLTLCDLGSGFVDFPTDIKAVTLHTALVMVNVVASFFGTLANGLVIMVYCRNPRLRTVQNTIFMLLAITDFSVTAFLQPIYVILTLGSLLGNNNCILQGLYILLSSLFVQLSLVTIIILSLQSSITLAYPYHYQSIITKRRLIVVFVVSWLFVLLISLGMFRFPEVAFYGCYCIIASTILIVVVTWFRTCKLVARHRKAIQNTQTPSGSENVANKKVQRSTVTAFVIISSLLACYFLDLFYLFFKNYINASWLGDGWFMICRSLSVTLVHLNALLNPCLVLWRSTPYREAVKNIV